MLTYIKDYTPVLKYLNPPVVYKDALTEFHFNPKNIANLIKDVASDDLPFVNAKINGALVDFEDFVNNTLKIQSWRPNMVRGRVTDQPPAKDGVPQMLWETGNALFANTMKTCTYDMSECYVAKTIPVIHKVSANDGYTTGGQNVTISGYGFDNATLDIQVAGQNCSPTFVSKEVIHCMTSSSSVT